MRILFADSIAADRLAPLTAAGHECVVEPKLRAEDLPARIAGFHGLVIRSTKVSADAIKAADHLEVIVRAGAGTDNVDKQAASDRGVYVCNVPGKNAVAVAELAMGLLLATDRHIADGTADLRAGVWNKATYSKADGLLGKNFAVIGLGDIGLAVAERAKAFGMTVSAVKKASRSAETLQRIRTIGIRMVDDQPSLLRSADVVSLHVPKTADTLNLVDAAFLAQMKDDATLLNTSRGDIVDEDALLDALNKKSLRAGLDVFANEPKGGDGEFQSALAQHPRVVGSHHIGASTQQAQDAVADGTVSVLQSFASGQISNCVNLATQALGTASLSVRHLDRVGVLAAVLMELRTGGINVQQMQNQIFAGGQAAVATINVGSMPDAAMLDRLGRIENVISATVAPAIAV